MRGIRLLAISLLMCTSAYASAPVGALGGVVTRFEVSTPLTNVEVVLRAHDESPPLVSRTDDEGRFRFLDLPPGLYRLEASRPGFDLKVIDPIVVPSALLRSEHVVMRPVLAPIETPTPAT